MNPYKLKIQFIILIWTSFILFRLFFSEGIDLLVFLMENGARITNDSLIVNYVTLQAAKWIGIFSGIAVVLNLFRKVFFPFLILCFVIVCYAIFLAIGSYGLWAFYFLPFCVLAFSIYTEKYEKALVYLTICYVSFYVFAGFSKIYPFWNAIDWMQGYTIENLLLARQHESLLYRSFGVDIFSYPHWIIKSGVVGSVLLELSAVLILFYNRAFKWIVPLLILFHLTLFLTGTPGIVEYTFAAIIFVPLNYVAFINSMILKTKNKIFKFLYSINATTNEN